MEYKFKIKDKVFVKNWYGHYKIEKYKINWRTNIPNNSSVNFFIKKTLKPLLTLHGIPYKNGRQTIDKIILEYKNYEYVILERTMYLDKKMYLIKSNNGCFTQVKEDCLTKMTIAEQKKVKHLETETHLQALAKDNLNKWSADDNLKTFPDELLKFFYDSNQEVLFGKNIIEGIVIYKYIPKEYTINKKPLYVCCSIEYNDEGCNLSNKPTISITELKKIFN